VLQVGKTSNIFLIDNSYEQHGKRSKEKIRVVRNLKEETYHTITIPLFTDDSDVEKAIIFAHELGHYFVWKSSSKIKRSVLYTILDMGNYINDRLAWKKAKEILVKEGIIDEKGDENQRKAFEDFLQIKYSRSVENPLFSIIRAISRVCKRLFSYFIYSYLLVGILLVFEANHIPIPYINKIGFDVDHFHTDGMFVFSVIIISKLSYRMFSFSAKIGKQNN